MSAWRHHARRLRFALTMLAGALVIGAAVFVGLVQLLLPLATRYPDVLARELSARLHRPVSFASLRSEWQPSGPLLTVTELKLGAMRPGGASITLPHAALKFDFGAWLRPAHRWITLRLNDMELRIEHAPSGWSVAGFANADDGSHAALQSLPVDLDLHALRVDIVDPAAGRAWKLYAPQLRVVNVGDVIEFGGSIQQVGTRQAVNISGRMDAPRNDYTLHLKTRQLDLADAVRGLDLRGYALARGDGDIELWGNWHDGKVASLAARYDLHDVSASGPGGRRLELAALAGVARATRVDGGWDLAWRGPGRARANIDEAGGAIVRLRGKSGDWHITAAARDMDATPWLALLAMAPQAPAALVDWITQAQPHLRIDSAALAWRDAAHYAATAQLSGLHAAAAGAIPGIALGKATLRADAQAASLDLAPGPASVAVTHVFRKPFVFKRLAGTLVAWRDAGVWSVAAEGLDFDTGTLAGTGRARLDFPGGDRKPFLEAYATVQRAKATDAGLFWPYRTMPPKLVAWLDRAFVSGDVTSGRALVRGNLGDWPFLAHEGRFEASGVVRGAVFDYDEHWPRATELDAAVDFVDNRMGIVASHAKVQGVVVTHAVATIPDLAHGVLGLDIAGAGKGNALLDFVRHSPIGVDAVDVLQGLTMGGEGKLGIKLSIPLDDAEKFSLDGRLDLAGADVRNDRWNLQLGKLAGPFLIHGRGFRADGLTADFRGAPATLSLAVGSGVADPDNLVEASLDATLSAQKLAQGYPELAGIVAHASGVAPFHVGVVAAHGKDGGPVLPTLTVNSSLAGIALDLPAPLDKPASATLPLSLSLRLPPAGAPLAVALGDVLQVRARMPDPARHTPLALAVAFGPTAATTIPASGMVVSGHAQRLDLGGWIAQAVAGSTSDAFPALAHADVTTDAATVFGSNLGSLHFTLDAGAAGDAITLDGAAVQGTLEVPTTGLMTRGISAHLSKLYWPEAPAPAHPGPVPPADASSPVAPAAVPPLHATVADLRLGKARLGATAFESAPTATGMHIAKFESKGEDFSISAHGDWNGDTRASASHMLIDIDASDFGGMLDGFGFGGLLAGGKDTRLHVDGTWPGAPSAFSLAWMTGSVDLQMGEGRILALKPGLGRLLGLLSLRELPSRLLLHFGDVFKSGFGFDHASAKLSFKRGDAYTQDLLIKAPAAQIAMQGRAGFHQRDFDMTVHMTPHVGGTLPVVGAVIGGPVGAAAGLVMQGILGKGINKAAGSTYSVTGSWDKPKIVTIHEEVPASASSEALPAATTSAAVPAVGVQPAPATSVPAAASSSDG